MKKLAAFVLALTVLPAFGEITVPIHFVDGQGVGSIAGEIIVADSADGSVLIPSLKGLPPGIHSIHLHENPNCAPQIINGKPVAAGAAGDRYDSAGVLPNLHVEKDGSATKPLAAPKLKGSDLFGRALIIQAGLDSNARIACGQISTVIGNNSLSDKLIDGDGKHYLSPDGDRATLKDIGLGEIPKGSNPAVRVVRWSKIPGEISQMGYAGSRLFFATVTGKIWEYTPQGNRIMPELLNIAKWRPAFSMQGSFSGRGLRGFAFHPEFLTNGLLYTMHLEIGAKEKVSHGPADSPMHYVLAEWKLNPDGKQPPEFRDVIRVGYRATDHAGGQIGFNPAAKPGDADYGLLYAGFGDGGGACSWSNTCNDQFGYGQDFSVLQSSIIRINPLRQGKKPYSIPVDNPFLEKNDPRHVMADEIFAKGFRNPSTIMFDQKNGRLYTGDISQNTIEEINFVEPGKNYGWGVSEGTWIFTDKTDTDNSLRYIPLGDGSDVTALSATYTGKSVDGKPVIFHEINRMTDDYTYPVAQLSHRENGGVAAIVTGPAYHGTDVPELEKLLLFTNLSQDKIYYINQDEAINDKSPAQVFELGLLNENGEPSSLGNIIIGKNDLANNKRANLRFGQDREGKVYLISKHNKIIYQLRSP